MRIHPRWTCAQLPRVTLLLVLVIGGCHSRDAARQTHNRPAGDGVLIIAYAPDSADTFAAPNADSALVLDWLQKSCAQGGVDLEVRNYPFGTLVTRVGARRNGDGGNWLYKVNGQMVPEAVSAHRVSTGDTVMLFFKQ